MSSIYFFSIAGLLTLICAYLIWSDIWKGPAPERVNKKPAVEIILLVSIALIIWGCFKLEPVTDQGIHFSLTAAVVIAILLIQGMYLIGLWKHGVRGLGLFLLPATAVLLLLIPLLPESNSDQWIHTSSLLESGHLLISLLAYAILTLAAFHAIMHLILDRSLKLKKISPVIQAMPSLFEIETHLFAQVRWATSLLAIGILTGLTWQWVEFQHFALFSHKVLLALFSFAVLILLLSKRKKVGWHGRRASHMVLAAYTLLLLAYFGAKLISSWLA
ncbi:MAG: cytochrome c biogenesis protein CcsA [Mariprofundaceae bacterium]